MPQSTLEFPVIECVEGGLSEDGQAVLLKLTTVEDAAIHFCLRHSDIEAFVTYLLCMASSRMDVAPRQDRTQYQPIPASGICAGELADGMGCLGVTVGSRADVPIADRGRVQGGGDLDAGRRLRSRSGVELILLQHGGCHPAIFMMPLIATYTPTQATTAANNSDNVRFRGASSVAKRHAASPPATAPPANKAASRQSIKPEAA
jgi:hypothetical protein